MQSSTSSNGQASRCLRREHSNSSEGLAAAFTTTIKDPISPRTFKLFRYRLYMVDNLEHNHMQDTRSPSAQRRGRLRLRGCEEVRRYLWPVLTSTGTKVASQELMPPHHARQLCFRRRLRTASKHFLSPFLAAGLLLPFFFVWPLHSCPCFHNDHPASPQCLKHNFR